MKSSIPINNIITFKPNESLPQPQACLMSVSSVMSSAKNATKTSSINSESPTHKRSPSQSLCNARKLSLRNLNSFSQSRKSTLESLTLTLKKLSTSLSRILPTVISNSVSLPSLTLSNLLTYSFNKAKSSFLKIALSQSRPNSTLLLVASLISRSWLQSFLKRISVKLPSSNKSFSLEML